MKILKIVLLVLAFNLGGTKFSFGILTHNEKESLDYLLKFLVAHRQEGDEIVIVDDFSTELETQKILESVKNIPNVFVYQRHLQRDFGGQRNFMKSKCSGDYCFFLDADECPTEYLMQSLSDVVSAGDYDSYSPPRINLIDEIGVDDKRLNAKGYVSWPDHQERIFKNVDSLYFVNNVHETLFPRKRKRYFLPSDEKYAIIHRKNIKTWEGAHKFYVSCYKEWLAKALKDKNQIVISNILSYSPIEHVNFFKDEEIINLIPEGKRSRILKLCEKIRQGKDVGNALNSLINQLAF